MSLATETAPTVSTIDMPNGTPGAMTVRRHNGLDIVAFASHNSYDAERPDMVLDCAAFLSADESTIAMGGVFNIPKLGGLEVHSAAMGIRIKGVGQRIDDLDRHLTDVTNAERTTKALQSSRFVFKVLYLGALFSRYDVDDPRYNSSLRDVVREYAMTLDEDPERHPVVRLIDKHYSRTNE